MLFRLSRRVLGRAALVLSPCLIAVTLPAFAADEFAVTPAQMQSMGIRVQRLEKSSESSGQVYSARVIFAPGQELVVSAPLAGVVDQLLIGQNEAVKPGQALLRLASPELGEQQLKLMEAASRNRLAQKPCNERSNWHPKVSCPSAGRRTHRTPPPRSKPACDRLRPPCGWPDWMPHPYAALLKAAPCRMR
jgi:hypothetical protein